VEVISSSVEVQIYKEKERDARTCVLDIGATNHMSECRAAFMKIDMVMLGTVCFCDDLVARIEGRRTVMFMSKNGESQSFDEVYFIPRLTTNIVSVGQLNEIDYKIDINTIMMKI
jgi:hypothetical protein